MKWAVAIVSLVVLENGPRSSVSFIILGSCAAKTHVLYLETWHGKSGPHSGPRKIALEVQSQCKTSTLATAAGPPAV